MTKDNGAAASALIAAAATSFAATENAQPWAHGWSIPQYRDSQEACLAGPAGPIKLTEDGKRSFVVAVEGLQRNAEVKRRWKTEEVWEIAGSLLATLASGGISEDLLRRWVAWIANASESVNIFPVANISWSGPPLVVGSSVIGCANEQFVDSVNAALSATDKVRERAGEYVNGLTRCKATGDVVVFACRTTGQSQLAHREAIDRFNLITDLLLLLIPNREALSLYSQRGDDARPGIRGLKLDRLAMERYLGEHARHEMVAAPLVLSGPLDKELLYWASPDLLPLERLLGIDGVRRVIEEALALDGPVASRLRVSARWFSQAFWASEPEDAALALGVALDALIGSKSGLPSRAMAERFAFLEADVDARRIRYKSYQDIFGVRSSVAHGGSSSRVQDIGYLRSVEREVSWAARRLIALDSAYSPKSQEAFDVIFDDFRWGTTEWPTIYAADVDLDLPAPPELDPTAPCGCVPPGHREDVAPTS